jgi:hypothetical protein
MEELTLEVSKLILSNINDKILPIISQKYNIKLDELVELVSNINNTINEPIKATPIKATPIKATPIKASSKQEKSSDLQEKINKCKEQNKVLNISTGRPLVDNTANRKKYKFYDELGIAGLEDDEKLKNSLKLLSSSTLEKIIPIHEQAEKAKKRAKSNEIEEKSCNEIEKSCNEIEKKTINQDDNIDNVLKLSELLEDSESELKEEDLINKNKKKELNAKYNSEIKQWWNPERQYILKKKGIRNIVIGKLYEGNIIKLNEKDIEECKKNGWGYE